MTDPQPTPHGAVHLLDVLHYHPQALTDLVADYRAHRAALMICAQLIGGDLPQVLLHQGAQRMAVRAREILQAERAAAEQWADVMETVIDSPGVAAQNRAAHPEEGHAETPAALPVAVGDLWRASNGLTYRIVDIGHDGDLWPIQTIGCDGIHAHALHHWTRGGRMAQSLTLGIPGALPADCRLLERVSEEVPL